VWLGSGTPEACRPLISDFKPVLLHFGMSSLANLILLLIALALLWLAFKVFKFVMRLVVLLIVVGLIIGFYYFRMR
jgi:uncharacterized membrane protein